MLPRNYLLDYYVLYLPGGGAPSNSLHPYFTLTLINILLLLIIILLIIIAIAIACRFDAVLIVELCLCSLFFPASLFRLLHCGHIAAPLLRLHLYDAKVSNGVVSSVGHNEAARRGALLGKGIRARSIKCP